MVGGGSRRDESLVINSTNVFAALGSLKKKKNKEQGSSKSKSSSVKKTVKEPEKEVYWTPAPLKVESWADVDDDDDDFYATTAPPSSAWGPADSKSPKETETAVEVIQSVNLLFIHCLSYCC